MHDNRQKAVLRILLPVALLVVAGMMGWFWQMRANWPEQPPPTPTRSQPSEQPAVGLGVADGPSDERFFRWRQQMVQTQIRARGIHDENILRVISQLPRHCFVPEPLQDSAYADWPLPIGHGQTISQPYIVALMTEQARPRPDSRALDVGTGSGYQAAILAELCREVYSIEIIEPLAKSARLRLNERGYKNVHVRHGDGYRGWPEHAPFDLIIVAAAPNHVPEPLVQQLAAGGRLVIPVGRFAQNLLVIEKQPDGSIRQTDIAAVSFVPMTGEAQQEK